MAKRTPREKKQPSTSSINRETRDSAAPAARSLVKNYSGSSHVLLTAGVLMLLSVYDDHMNISACPVDLAPDRWMVRIAGWEYVCVMDTDGPERVVSVRAPGDSFYGVFDQDPGKRQPRDLDMSWEHVLTHATYIEAVRERILLACQIHPDWPYSNDDE